MTWWLSFADDEGFRGVVLVDGPDSMNFLEAMVWINHHDCNPHGQVYGIAFHDTDPLSAAERAALNALPRLKILGLRDIEAMNPVNLNGERPQ